MMAGKMRASVWIVTRPGPLRDGLHTLLSSIPEIEITGEMADVAVILKVHNEHQPDLILLDAGLPGGEAWKALKDIKSKWPKAHCIVLADDGVQAQRARAVYADIVLQKGMPASAFVQAIEAGLCQRK
jgi:DNA-binding NarL/FixJ family response regulator